MFTGRGGQRCLDVAFFSLSIYVDSIVIQVLHHSQGFAKGTELLYTLASPDGEGISTKCLGKLVSPNEVLFVFRNQVSSRDFIAANILNL